MKSAAAIVAFAASLAVASAQGIILSYGEPISATVWTVGGSTNQIKLNNDCHNSTAGFEFPVTLNIQVNGLQQPYPDAKSPLVIGTLNCEKKGATIKVAALPDTLPSGGMYSILVKVGTDLSYSALFKINNAKVPAVSTTSSAAPATTSGVPPRTSAPAASKPATASPTGTSGAGALKVGSTVALVVVAAAGLLL